MKLSSWSMLQNMNAHFKMGDTFVARPSRRCRLSQRSVYYCHFAIWRGWDFIINVSQLFVSRRWISLHWESYLRMNLCAPGKMEKSLKHHPVGLKFPSFFLVSSCSPWPVEWVKDPELWDRVMWHWHWACVGVFFCWIAWNGKGLIKDRTLRKIGRVTEGKSNDDDDDCRIRGLLVWDRILLA